MIDLEIDDDSHYVHESICVNCGYRFIHVRPTSVLLKDCECAECKQTGFIIKTGQEIDDMSKGSDEE